MIVWGKKIVRSHLGYVADFCPVCAGARPFALTRVGSAGHLYFISVDEGALVGHERTCLLCTVPLEAQPSQYAGFAEHPGAMRELVKATFPQLAQVHRERLALEQVIRVDPTLLPAGDRQSLILEPFLLLSVKVSERFERSAFSSNSGFLKNEVLPVLARALRRLRPSEAELQAALVRLAQMKELMGSKIKLADLMAEIRRAPPKDSMALLPQMGSAGSLGAGHRHGAARLMRWLSYGLGAVGVLLGFLAWFPDEKRQSADALVLLLVLAAALGVGVHRASVAVAQGLAWGRSVGLGLGVLLLFGFPIGTAVGAYLLWSLGLKWRGADGR